MAFDPTKPIQIVGLESPLPICVQYLDWGAWALFWFAVTCSLVAVVLNGMVLWRGRSPRVTREKDVCREES